MTDREIIEEALKLVSTDVSVTMPVSGRSMLPFIVGGRDSVILQNPAGLKKGDIVLAWVEGNRYVLHRIIRLEGDDVVLMGDGNLKAVESCKVRDVKAIACYVVNGKTNRKHYLYGRKMIILAKCWGRLIPFRKYLLALYSRI